MQTQLNGMPWKSISKYFPTIIYNIKTENLIYRNYYGMNISHLHLPWECERIHSCPKSPPCLITLVIYVITSYDADTIIVDGLEYAD